jgi:predicted phosphate transport protein (TIGR00153 family)
MLIFKKEKQVSELAMQHVDSTCACLRTVAEAVRAYVSGSVDECAAAATEVNRFESEADKLLRDIRVLLYEGAYLPTIRGDIHNLLSKVDDVANKAQDCYDFVNYQRPRVADEYAAEIIAIIDLTLGCSSEFRKAIKKYFKPKGEMEKLREHAKRVSELESRIDDSERTLTAAVFQSTLSLSEKQHLRGLIEMTVRISDHIEDAADELQLVSLKSIV